MNFDNVIELEDSEISEVNGGYDLIEDVAHAWGYSDGQSMKAFLITGAYRMRHYLSAY